MSGLTWDANEFNVANNDGDNDSDNDDDNDNNIV